MKLMKASRCFRSFVVQTRDVERVLLPQVDQRIERFKIVESEYERNEYGHTNGRGGSWMKRHFPELITHDCRKGSYNRQYRGLRAMATGLVENC